MEMLPIHSQGRLCQRALDEYALSLKSLDAVRPLKKLRVDSVLSVLMARDEVERSMGADGCERSVGTVRRLIELDDRLRKGAGRMVRVVKARELERWRSSVKPAESAWWWWLERVVVDHPLNRLDGLWRLMMVAGWTANITLMVNLAARFLGGGVGLAGVAAVALPSVLGLLQIGTEFTKAGKEGFDSRSGRRCQRFLGVIRVPPQWREEMKLVITVGMLGVLCVVWLQLPVFSKMESQGGVKSYQEGKLGDAEQSFLKAIALDADNADAHYNLGSLYDKLEQPEKAKKEYLIAIAGNLPDAYNNLARLYLQEKKYSQAAALLIQAMSKQEKSESVEAQTRYSLAKNLGWVRLEQKRDEEAQEWLKVAIGIAESRSGVKVEINPGMAYCLLAQAMERQKKPAITEWKTCRELGSMTNPDEDALLYQAGQRLKKK